MVYDVIILMGVVYFLVGMVLLAHQVRHLLRVLVCLEIIIFGVIIIIFFILLGSVGDTLFCLLMLVFVVCEGCVGLGLLVSMRRSHGRDYMEGLRRYL